MNGTDPAALPLRDIHLPEVPGWWPPAPGWWLLALLVVLGAIAVLAWRRRRRRLRPREQALAALARLERQAADGESAAQVLVELSALLRRYALTQRPRAEVAGLAGDEWVRFLARTGGGVCFERGPGRRLADGPYRPAAALSREELQRVLAASRAWVVHQPLRNATC